MIFVTVPGAVGKRCPDLEPPSLLGEKPTSPRHREVAHPGSVLRGLLFSSQTPLRKGTFGGTEDLLKPCPTGLLDSGCSRGGGEEGTSFP